MNDVMMSMAAPRGGRGGTFSGVSGDEPFVRSAGAPAIIRGACILLVIVGAVSVLFSAPVVLDPANTRCHLARTWLNDANTDTKAWNNVDTGGQKATDLGCADAIRLAGQIKLKEQGTKTASVPGESALKLQNAVAMLLGFGQAAAGVLLLRSMSRGARNAALAFSAFGIVLQILGIFSMLVFAFVVYAFTFSPASRELWPKEPRDG
jgi:hypothetical protein